MGSYEVLVMIISAATCGVHALPRPELLMRGMPGQWEAGAVSSAQSPTRDYEYRRRASTHGRRIPHCALEGSMTVRITLERVGAGEILLTLTADIRVSP